MLGTVRPGRDGRRGSGPVFVCLAADSTGHSPPDNALQALALARDAVRERQALALVARHGLTISIARVVAEMAFSGPGRRA